MTIIEMIEVLLACNITIIRNVKLFSPSNLVVYIISSTCIELSNYIPVTDSDLFHNVLENELSLFLSHGS